MKFRRLLLSLLLISVALPAKAWAADEPTAQTEKAPASPVPLHTIAFRVSPISLLFRAPGGEIDVGVGRRLTLGANYSLFKAATATTRFDVYEAGVTAGFYLDGERFEDSWIVRTTAAYVPVSVSQTTPLRLQTAEGETWVGAVSLGHEWLVAQHLSITLAAGVAVYRTPETRETGAQPTATALAGYCL